jgi:hypothetical protein
MVRSHKKSRHHAHAPSSSPKKKYAKHHHTAPALHHGETVTGWKQQDYQHAAAHSDTGVDEDDAIGGSQAAVPSAASAHGTHPRSSRKKKRQTRRRG